MPPFRLLAFAFLALPLAAVAEPIRVTGWIEEADPSVRIELFPAWEDYEAAIRREGAGLKPLATARPKPDGSFEINAPEAGAFRLVVRGEEGLAMEHLLVPLVEDTSLPEMFLPWDASDAAWLRGTGEASGWWLADPEPAKELVRFQIKVRDAGGEPVPAALVRRDGRVVARTGPEGGVEITAPQEAPLIVEGRDGSQARVTVPAPGQTAAVRLQPPRTIAGRVVGAVSRQPVAGALVWVGRPPVAPMVRTGADGAFRVAVPAGEEPFLEAAAAGHIPLAARAVKPGEREPVELALEPSATLSGIVVDGAGRAVAGARILSDPPRDRVFPSPWTAAVSGPDGRFRLTGLRPSGAYRLTAGRAGFVRTEKTARTAPAGQPSETVRIVLEEGQAVSGRVVDESGRPLAGAVVRLANMSGEEHSGESDGDGKFQIRHLRPGRYDLIAMHPEASAAQLSGIEIPAGQPVVDLGDVELPAGGVIEGLVVDAKGAPVAGAMISASSEGRRGFESFHDLRSAEDGTFRIPALRRGGRYDLGVHHPAFVDATVPGVEAPSAEPVRVVLRPGRSLKGRVVGPEGEPVAGASLSTVEDVRIGESRSYSSVSIATTDAEGRFQARRLPPGLLTLEVQAEEYRSRRVEGLLVPEDRDPEDLKIVLERRAQLEVRVLNAREEPAPQTMVRADPEGGDISRFSREYLEAICETDSRGRCRISIPGAGIYTLRAFAQGAAATARVEAGGGITPVEIRLPAGVEVSGRVIAEDGGPAGAYVELKSATGSFGLPTQPDGGFLFTDVTDGQYSLKAVQPVTSSSSTALDVVVAGRPVRGLELRLVQGGAGTLLTGRVLGLEPGEGPSASVVAMPLAGGAVPSGEVDSEGGYRIQDLEAGDWIIQVFTSTGRKAEANLRIEPGARTASLDLELPPRGGGLTGRVLVDGAPFAGAGVQGRRGSEIFGEARTAYDGSFTLPLQEPGAAITLLVYGPQGIGASRMVQAAGDSEVTVEIRTGRLRGTVVGQDGRPVEGAVIRIEGWSPELQTPLSGVTLRSGLDGVFYAPRLAAEAVRISVQAPGFAATETLTEVPPGGEGSVEIRLGSPDER